MNFSSLREALDARTALVADGATGTMLQAAGLIRGEPPERWNLERPDAIIGLAAGYLAVGSDLVYSNSFGGNRIRLEEAGLAEHFVEINRLAVAHARAAVQASGRCAWVVGSIGPTGQMLDPYGDLSEEAAYAAFVEQARVLLEAGVDGFACETFTAIEEARLCLRAVREVAPELPVFASMAFETGGRTMMGVAPEDAAAELTDLGADVVGANCSVGPDVVAAAIQAMRTVRPEARFLAKANAGLPKVDGDVISYPVEPEAMRPFAQAMRDAGAVIIGGCCGTTPAHVRAIREALDV
jgi:5-methyltetrahydrofolate--homocysteine methyltransferase